MVAINLRDFPADLHRSLKIRAAETGTTVKGLLMRYAEEGLKRDKKTTKPKKGG